MFSFCEIFKNTFFTEHLWWLLLCLVEKENISETILQPFANFSKIFIPFFLQSPGKYWNKEKDLFYHCFWFVTWLENFFNLIFAMWIKIRSHVGATALKMKFSINDFVSKCDQIRRKLLIWPHLLKKSLMENFCFLCSEQPHIWFITLLYSFIANVERSSGHYNSGSGRNPHLASNSSSSGQNIDGM